jgi:hypothetical protein
MINKEERENYPDIPMTEKDWKLYHEAGRVHSSDYMKIDETKADSRECFDKLKKIRAYLYNRDQANFDRMIDDEDDEEENEW